MLLPLVMLTRPNSTSKLLVSCSDSFRLQWHELKCAAAVYCVLNVSSSVDCRTFLYFVLWQRLHFQPLLAGHMSYEVPCVAGYMTIFVTRGDCVGV